VRGLVGKSAYRAPEMLGGGAYRGSPTDVWACGVVLLAISIGFIPWKRATEHDKTFSFLMEHGIRALLDKVLQRHRRPPTAYSLCASSPPLLPFLLETPDIEADTPADQFVDLLSCLLTPNPDERLTAEEALQHPWITRFPPLPSSPVPLSARKRLLSLSYQALSTTTDQADTHKRREPQTQAVPPPPSTAKTTSAPTGLSLPLRRRSEMDGWTGAGALPPASSPPRASHAERLRAQRDNRSGAPSDDDKTVGLALASPASTSTTATARSVQSPPVTPFTDSTTTSNLSFIPPPPTPFCSNGANGSGHPGHHGHEDMMMGFRAVYMPPVDMELEVASVDKGGAAVLPAIIMSEGRSAPVVFQRVEEGGFDEEDELLQDEYR